jgi:hypothetical protein
LGGGSSDFGGTNLVGRSAHTRFNQPLSQREGWCSYFWSWMHFI